MKKQIFQIIAVIAVTMAECAVPCMSGSSQAAAAPALSGRAIIDVRDCGASPTNSAARNTEIIQACIDSLQTGQTLLINGKYRILGLDRITFIRNRYSGPSDKPDTVVYDIDPNVGAGTSMVNISKNSLKSIARLWSCGDDNKITNPNLVLKP